VLLPTGIAHKFTTDRPTSSCCVSMRNEYVTYVCRYIHWMNITELLFFLANVNSHSPSLMSSSVCLSSVCLLSVTFVRPTQAIEIFRNVFTPFGTLAIC